MSIIVPLKQKGNIKWLLRKKELGGTKNLQCTEEFHPIFLLYDLNPWSGYRFLFDIVDIEYF